MDVLKLTGGKVIGAAPMELPVPQWRVGTPATLLGTLPMRDQLKECTRKEYGMPEVEFVKVVFREVENVVYLVMAPFQSEEAAEFFAKNRGSRRAKRPKGLEDVYKLSITRKAPAVYGLSRLFRSLGFSLRQDCWFVMETHVVEDDQLGYAVAGDWTHATIEARELVAKKETAAGTNT